MRDPQREAKLFQASLDGNLDLVNELLPKTYVDAKNENSKWTFLMCAGNVYFFLITIEYIPILNVFFRQFKSFKRFRLAFVFGLQTF